MTVKLFIIRIQDWYVSLQLKYTKSIGTELLSRKLLSLAAIFIRSKIDFFNKNTFDPWQNIVIDQIVIYLFMGDYTKYIKKQLILTQMNEFKYFKNICCIYYLII